MLSPYCRAGFCNADRPLTQAVLTFGDRPLTQAVLTGGLCVWPKSKLQRTPSETCKVRKGRLEWSLDRLSTAISRQQSAALNVTPLLTCGLLQKLAAFTRKMTESDEMCNHNLQKRRCLFRFVPLFRSQEERNKGREIYLRNCRGVFCGMGFSC